MTITKCSTYVVLSEVAWENKAMEGKQDGLLPRGLIIFDGTAARDGVILMTAGGKFRMTVRTYR